MAERSKNKTVQILQYSSKIVLIFQEEMGEYFLLMVF